MRGDPPPRISWRLNGSNLTLPNSTGTITTTVEATNNTYTVISTLLLTNISFEEHNGSFVCTGLNRYGYVIRATEVVVQGNFISLVFI